MVEKIKTVRNPLTIIAIFAGLAEISGTVALGALSIELQTIFIWFVILFPSILVILFFITLNFNPKVLYAPGDFKDEKNFITTMYPDISDGSISKIEVEKENVEIYKGINEVASTTLQKGKEKFSSIVRENFDDKQLIANANSFFKCFMNLIEQEENFKNQFSSWGFGMHSDGMYLLSIKINREKNDTDRLVRNLDFIIHVFRNEKNQINLEVIGWKNEKISSKLVFTKPEELAKAIFDHITNIIESILSLREKNNIKC